MYTIFELNTSTYFTVLFYPNLTYNLTITYIQICSHQNMSQLWRCSATCTGSYLIYSYNMVTYADFFDLEMGHFGMTTVPPNMCMNTIIYTCIYFKLFKNLIIDYYRYITFCLKCLNPLVVLTVCNHPYLYIAV